MTADGFIAPPSDRDVHKSTLDVTWGRAIKVWWSLMWRTVVFGGIAGALLGAVTGLVMGIMGASHEAVSAVTLRAGMLVSIPVGIWVVRRVLTKTFADFRIALLAKTNA